MSRSLERCGISHPASRLLDSNAPSTSARTLGMSYASSRITALSVEFVAKPNEAHKVHAALPAAIEGAMGEVAGFAGSFVMIANHEARIVTVVTLWSGEDHMNCSENIRWVRALLTPYLDRCLRVQTLAAYVPAETAVQVPREFEQSCSDGAMDNELKEEATICVV